jgi:hypothetical protein
MLTGASKYLIKQCNNSEVTKRSSCRLLACQHRQEHKTVGCKWQMSAENSMKEGISFLSAKFLFSTLNFTFRRIEQPLTKFTVFRRHFKNKHFVKALSVQSAGYSELCNYNQLN